MTLTPTHLDVQLSLYEQIGALRRPLHIPRDQILSARVDPEPVRAIRGRLKVGLRVPGRLYVCSTDRGGRFWAVRAGDPALTVRLSGEQRLHEVTVTTPEAERLAAELDPS